MLKVENLSIEYAGINALRNVSLRVEEKEIVSVIGANGGGKDDSFEDHFRDSEAQAGQD